MADNNYTYKVKSDGFVFSLDKSEIDPVDLIPVSPTEYNLIYQHRSVNTHLLETDDTGKKMKIEVGGEVYAVEIKDELEQMLEVVMGFGEASAKYTREIKAPMPGLVLSINVTEGQEVKKGDKILILEAMKMENSILTHADAVVKKIAVTAGMPVEKGQVLVELA